MSKMHYFWQEKRTYRGQLAFIHSIAEKGYSRKLGFRLEGFSETELPVLDILGNPVSGTPSLRSASPTPSDWGYGQSGTESQKAGDL